MFLIPLKRIPTDFQAVLKGLRCSGNSLHVGHFNESLSQQHGPQLGLTGGGREEKAAGFIKRHGIIHGYLPPTTLKWSQETEKVAAFITLLNLTSLALWETVDTRTMRSTKQRSCSDPEYMLINSPCMHLSAPNSPSSRVWLRISRNCCKAARVHWWPCRVSRCAPRVSSRLLLKPHGRACSKQYRSLRWSTSSTFEETKEIINLATDHKSPNPSVTP